jgi:putative nucleotidyltransferase with HDIG domain
MSARSPMKQKLWIAVELALLGAGVAAAALTWRVADWEPVELSALLLVLVGVGHRMNLTVRHQKLSAAFITEVLIMTLLGPAPAVIMGLVLVGYDALRRRLEPLLALNNLCSTITFLAAGSIAFRAIMGDPHASAHQAVTQSVGFALAIFALFLVTNALNFALVAVQYDIVDGRPFLGQTRELFIPLLPGQIAAAALAAILAVAYTNLGYPVLLALVVVLVIFQSLAVALLRSEDRADQLEARSVHLASLQLGVLTTLVETLALRDRTTARHAAAVARYARELAEEIGCDETEQDLVHTAGLLHDIGKFVLPDKILHAEILSDDDWSVIRRHPQDGATLVGRLDGYGPVADVILYHHERVDGAGYPAGLIGNEIPLASRIISVCSTFDTLTSRDTYRSPMTAQDAMVELRRVAGRQLDSELVEAFIAILKREGPEKFTDGDNANFAAELAFEQRVRQMAQPKPSA